MDDPQWVLQVLSACALDRVCICVCTGRRVCESCERKFPPIYPSAIGFGLQVQGRVSFEVAQAVVSRD